MSWNEGLTQLQTILSELYDDENASKEIVEKANLPDGKIEYTSAKQENWYNILVEADKQKKVEAIVNIAISEYKAQKEALIKSLELYTSQLEKTEKVKPSSIPHTRDEPPRKKRGAEKLPNWIKGVIGLVTLIIGFIVLTIVLNSRSAGSILNVQIWDVKQDEKNSIVASTRIRDSSSDILTDEELQHVGDWIIEQIVDEYNLNSEEIQLSVHVPADLENERIEVFPTEFIDYYIWIIYDADTGPIKSRIPHKNSVAELGKDFLLSFERPGYSSQTIEVKWGQELNQDFLLQPLPVDVGIEAFAGERNSIADQLADYLAKDPRLLIKDPATLEKMKEEIEANADLLAENPVIQEDFRAVLGLDLIVSGSYEELESN